MQMPRKRKKKQTKKEDLETYKSLNEQFWDFIFSGIERAIGKKKEQTARSVHSTPSSNNEKEEKKQNIPQIARY